MLIEADKRGPEYEIRLTYSIPGKRFNVPENVHLLGLMNTGGPLTGDRGLRATPPFCVRDAKTSLRHEEISGIPAGSGCRASSRGPNRQKPVGAQQAYL